GGVAEHGAGILRGRGTPGKGGAHAADTLFVDGKTVCQNLAGGCCDSDRKSGLEGIFDHRAVPTRLTEAAKLSGKNLGRHAPEQRVLRKYVKKHNLAAGW